MRKLESRLAENWLGLTTKEANSSCSHSCVVYDGVAFQGLEYAGSPEWSNGLSWEKPDAFPCTPNVLHSAPTCRAARLVENLRTDALQFPGTVRT